MAAVFSSMLCKKTFHSISPARGSQRNKLTAVPVYLRSQPKVCAETCTDDVLNTKYNKNGDICGSGIVYSLRRESEADACA